MQSEYRQEIIGETAINEIRGGWGEGIPDTKCRAKTEHKEHSRPKHERTKHTTHQTRSNASGSDERHIASKSSFQPTD